MAKYTTFDALIDRLRKADVRAMPYYDPGDSSVGIPDSYGLTLDGEWSWEDSRAFIDFRGEPTMYVVDGNGVEALRAKVPFPIESTGCAVRWVLMQMSLYGVKT